MKYPRYDVYENMYKRYFKKGVDYLTREADLKVTDKVLDLCGGNGRLTKMLKTLASDVTYVDQESDMIPDDLEDLGIKVINKSVQDFIEDNKEQYDKVFCEQAVNYWLKHIDMSVFSKIFKKDGLFIFNTFANKPSNKPMIKEYVIDDINYLEVSYLVDKKVEHVQIREGYEPHFTVFDWISEDEFMNLLSPYFEVKKKSDGRSVLYIARRK